MKILNGVNLGGWMIPEKWMTPSLFKDSKANDLAGLVKTQKGQKAMKDHVRNWIKEEDFAFMAKNGVKIVRLPFGFWVFDKNNIFGSSVDNIDWVMDIAEKYKIQVILDMHAPRKSQNGEQHSGKEGEPDWFLDKKVRKETEEVLVKIAQRYAERESFYGIELLNEPKLGRHYFRLLWWYRRVFGQLNKILPKNKKIIFHDAFHPIAFAGALRGRRAVMDVHWYIIAPGIVEKILDFEGYLKFQRMIYGFCIIWCKIFRTKLIVGEYGSVLPQKYFDKTPQSQHMDLLAKNIENQRKIYQNLEAVCFWSYKSEFDGMWNWRSLIEKEVIEK